MPRINNSPDITPNSRWDIIFNSFNGIFKRKMRARKGERARIKYYLQNIIKHKYKLRYYDSKVLAEELIEYLKPGITTTLLLEKKQEIDEIRRKYRGTEEGAYTKIKLKIKNPKKKFQILRLQWKKDYEMALFILESLNSEYAYNAILKDLLEKVELVTFCRGGDRLARWTLDDINSEYSKEEDCYTVAAKLIFLILDIIEDDLKKKRIVRPLEKIQECKQICLGEFNDKEKHFIQNIFPKSVCPLCLSKIKLVDFFRNGRNDPKSIVFGHYEYRGIRTRNVHIGKNAFWMHRMCNSIQDIYTIEEIMPFLKNVVKKQVITNINWEERG